MQPGWTLTSTTPPRPADEMKARFIGGAGTLMPQGARGARDTPSAAAGATWDPLLASFPVEDLNDVRRSGRQGDHGRAARSVIARVDPDLYRPAGGRASRLDLVYAAWLSAAGPK